MPTLSAPAPLTLVTGPESLLRDRAVSTVVAAARATDPETQVQDLSAAGLAPGRVTDLANPSLFGGTTLIVVRDLADAGEELADELKAVAATPADDVILVLVHPGGVKGKALVDAVKKAGAKVVECKPLKWEREKLDFVKAEFAAANRRITAEGAAALVDAHGSDLRELANACSQLVADTSGTVDAVVVERYYAGRVEVTGFRVADAAIEGRYAESLRLLRLALATGVDPVPLNAAFASGLRTLVKVAAASRTLRAEDLARELGIAPFLVKKARGQMAGWSPEAAEEAIVAVARADEQIKGGGTDQVYALERAVTAIVSARSTGPTG